MFIILSNFSDSLNAFLKSNALFLALAIVGLIIVTFVTLLVVNRKKKKDGEN